MKTLGLMLASALVLASCKPEEQPLIPDTPGRAKAPTEQPLPEKVSFNEHIQPILSENCYHCHGPDSGTREPKSEPLRLDLADKAFAPRNDAPPVIAKGDPAASSLVKLIRSTDEDEVMPPPASHKKLSRRDIQLIERWIEQGAEYQAHWSFIAPVKPSVPTGKNPIDHFIRERLAVEKLKPNPPEDPRRFYRRLHLDLTGLPPSQEETERFLKAKDPDAEIDTLLSSTAAAEHQARLWLDAARYADTHGIHIDNYRSIWPYRDWVVGAFKENMPWDQFTIEQIGGDLLPDATLDQKVATGFSRCLPTTGEGGAISEEYEAIYAKDRVETVSTVWLGLTTGCAACHDHKFDPISTADFYALSAFFRNTTMNAMDGNSADHPPNIFVPVPADRPRWTELTEVYDRIQSDLAKRKSEATADFEKWLVAAPKQTLTRLTPDSSLAVHIPFDTSESQVTGTSDGKPIELNISGNHRNGPFGPALLVGSVTADLGPLGGFSRTDQVSYGFHVFVEGKPDGTIIAKFDGGKEQRGWDISIKEGKIAAHVIDSWPDSANKITAKDPLKPSKWHHVFVTFDGSRASHQTMKVYIDGKALPGGPTPNTLGGDITSNTPLRIGSRNDGSEKLEGTVAIQDFRFYRRLLSPEEIKTLSEQNELKHFLSIPKKKRKKEQTAALLDHFLSTEDPRSLELLKELDAIRAPRDEIKQRGSISLIMTEKKDHPPEAHVLERGLYTSKGAKVSANVPVSLPPLEDDTSHDRLGFAKWLVAKENPLTARVTVNRAWQQFFGTGIVESSGDFGIMGSRPSHPALLDWLAVEFMDSGWDYRHILKLIVTSETYRQSAVISPEKLERDPYNKLLARGPRQRLDAEVIRDLALSASELLSNKTGGAPVKPYQPEGIWEAVAMPQSNTRTYKEDRGENLYRRSLYTFWKRTAPPPSMEILNAPSREVSCVRRDQTNTPLQALVLLNDPQFVEASKQLAAHAMKASDETDARIDFITARLLNRKLDPAQRKIITASLKDISASFAKNQEAAHSLLETGNTPADSSLPAEELAVWTLVTSQILNLDETVTR